MAGGLRGFANPERARVLSKLSLVAWLVFLATWTLALLTPQPAQLADTVLTEGTANVSAKALHVCTYAVLAFWSGRLGLSGHSRWLPLGVLSAHALATEFLQGYIPLRGPSWVDVGLDHVGIILGFIFAFPWRNGRPG
jgi:hypothetical protein